MATSRLPDVIETERFDLIWLDADTLRSFGERSADLLPPPHGWVNAHRHFLDDEAWIPPHFARRLDDDPSHATWTIRAIVERSSSLIVGHIGAHRCPDPQGVVEVGYTVAAARRREHIAQESLTGLLDAMAHAGSVSVVTLCISPSNEASIGLARSLGFSFVGEVAGDEEAPELRFDRQLDAHHC